VHFGCEATAGLKFVWDEARGEFVLRKGGEQYGNKIEETTGR